MNLGELTKKYEMAEKVHHGRINQMGEGAYQDSILVLKDLRRQMEEAGIKEGTPISVMLWPKK
jgi:hypothetical protein